MRILVALVKPRYHLSFASVVAGALLFAQPADRALALRLAGLYLSFNVLLYGGIYTFNDIADRAEDARHPIKRTRPVASGRLGVKRAAAVAVALCAAGLVMTAGLFPREIPGCCAAIVALNLAYSCGGRGMFLLDIGLNAAPHAVRFLMGALLAGRVPAPGHLAAWFCLAAAVACVRRLIEKQAGGEAARPVLRRYSASGLAVAADGGLLLVSGLCAADAMASPGFYLIVITAYALVVVLARRVSFGQSGLMRLWLH
jgi:4-hydroxybenzoate polyprenyltransferase